MFFSAVGALGFLLLICTDIPGINFWGLFMAAAGCYVSRNLRRFVLTGGKSLTCAFSIAIDCEHIAIRVWKFATNYFDSHWS
jgi:hypothetical protein